MAGVSFLEDFASVIDTHRKWLRFILLDFTDSNPLLELVRNGDAVQNYLESLSRECMSPERRKNIEIFYKLLNYLKNNENCSYKIFKSESSSAVAALMVYKKFNESFADFKRILLGCCSKNDLEQLIFQRSHETAISKLQSLLGIQSCATVPDFNVIFDALQEQKNEMLQLKNELQQLTDSYNAPVSEDIFQKEMTRILEKSFNNNNRSSLWETLTSPGALRLTALFFQTASFEMIKTLFNFKNPDNLLQANMAITSDEESKITDMTLIHCVAMNPDSGKIYDLLFEKHVITSKKDLFLTTRTGDQPYHVAAFYGNAKCIEYMYNKDEDNNFAKPNNNQEMPIHKAALGGDQQTFKFLHEIHNFELKILTRRMVHLFKNAAKDRCACIYDILDMTRGTKFINYSDENLDTPLHHAVRLEDPVLCAKLLRSGADLGALNASSKTPLDWMKSSFLLEILDTCVQKHGEEVIITNVLGSLENVRTIVQSLKERNVASTHPVIQALLQAEWEASRKIFYPKEMLHFLFALNTILYAYFITQPENSSSKIVNLLKYCIITFAILNGIIAILSVVLFIKCLETRRCLKNAWRNWANFCLFFSLITRKVDWCQCLLLIIVCLHDSLPLLLVLTMAAFSLLYAVSSISDSLLVLRYTSRPVFWCSAILGVLIYLLQFLSGKVTDHHDNIVTIFDQRFWNGLFDQSLVEKSVSYWLSLICTVFIVLFVPWLLFLKIKDAFARTESITIIQKSDIIDKSKPFSNCLQSVCGVSADVFEDKIKLSISKDSVLNLENCKANYDVTTIETGLLDKECLWETNFPRMAMKIWVKRNFVLNTTAVKEAYAICERTKNVYRDPKMIEII